MPSEAAPRPERTTPEAYHKPRVLLVHNSYRQRGGEDEVVAAEEALLRSHGHEVSVYRAENTSLRPGLVALGQALWNQGSYRELGEILRQRAPAIVHVHNTFPVISPSALYAAAGRGVPVVHTLHNYRLLCPAATLYRDGHVCEECVETQSLMPALVHGCYRGSRLTTAAAVASLGAHRAARSWQRHVAAFIALTGFARDKFIEAGFDPARLHVKPNFLARDPGRGSGSGGHALFVGRLTEEKGILTLLRAWKQMAPEWRLEIIGEGPLAPEVEAAGRSLPNLRWQGWLPKEEVLASMGRAAVLILPSQWYEGFPVTLVEAFATGLPAVVSRIGSLESLVQPGRLGLHFTPGDDADLAAKVSALLSAPSLLEGMRRAVRDEYQRSYTAEVNYASLSSVYESVLQRPSPQARADALASLPLQAERPASAGAVLPGL